MALTDQPYLPLYVDDWMNNNKLKQCSPGAHGVMVTIMCIMQFIKTERGKIVIASAHEDDNYLKPKRKKNIKSSK